MGRYGAARYLFERASCRHRPQVYVGWRLRQRRGQHGASFLLATRFLRAVTHLDSAFSVPQSRSIGCGISNAISSGIAKGRVAADITTFDPRFRSRAQDTKWHGYVAMPRNVATAFNWADSSGCSYIIKRWLPEPTCNADYCRHADGRDDCCDTLSAHTHADDTSYGIRWCWGGHHTNDVAEHTGGSCDEPRGELRKA